MADSRGAVMADAVRRAYRAGEDDETMEPMVLVDAGGRPVGRVDDGDAVIFYDLRGEREVELTRSFVDPRFDHFRRRAMSVSFATMIEYDPSLAVSVAFPPLSDIRETLSETVSAHGLRQVKVVESEKSIHLSYFLNGKHSEPFAGEQRVVIPSRHVLDVTEAPEMMAAEVAQATIEALSDDGNSLIVTNFANVDVVGHSTNAAAIKQAVSTVDRQIGVVADAALRLGVTVLIVADHGTVEKWLYADGAIDTGHTDSDVPCILVSHDLAGMSLRAAGELTDVAPTVLQLLGLPQPAALTGQSLLTVPVSGRSRVLLVIADGWGQREEAYGNLILEAATPVMDRLRATYPSTHLAAAGGAVGMPDGTVGNSEVGHLHIGAGRRIYSDRVRVERAIADGSFFGNPAFLGAMRQARENGTRLHLLGIISFYSSHGSVEHLRALLEMARRERASQVYVHGLLGRRGERPESGAMYVEEMEREMERLGVGQFASIIGRFWALDREENWDRVEKAYRWLVYGEGRPIRSEA